MAQMCTAATAHYGDGSAAARGARLSSALENTSDMSVKIGENPLKAYSIQKATQPQYARVRKLEMLPRPRDFSSDL